MTVLLACGCAVLAPHASSVPPPQADTTDTGVQGLDPAALPAFPPSGGRSPQPRRTSAGAQLSGTEWSQQNGIGNRDGQTAGSYVILPGAQEKTAWAVYNYPALTSERPIDLGVEVAASPLLPGGEDDLPLNYWIGLSDYTAYRWEWQGPYSAPQSLTLNSDAIRERYVSADGVFSFVVLCDASTVAPTPQNPDGLAAVEVLGGTTGLLSTVGQGYHSTTPHFAKIGGFDARATSAAHGASRGASAAGDPRVELDWTHVYDDYDPDSEAFGYRIYRRAWSEAHRVPIGDGSPGGVYVDPDDNYNGIDPPVKGQTYEYSIRAFNNSGWTRFASLIVAVPDETVLPPLNFDTLYMIPSSTTVGVGEPLTIQVATGQPAGLLQFLNTVSIRVESAGAYVGNSFNIGDTGGAYGDTDGYWALMGPPAPMDGEYLLYADSWNAPYDIGGGFHAYDFNITTLGPFDPPAVVDGAVLFNFQMSFGEPGVYHLGFQDFYEVDRTYYSDGDGINYYWGALDGPYTITVGAEQDDWWMFGHDRQHTRRSTFSGPATNALKSLYSTGADVFSSPAIGADGTVYVGSDDYKLYALNPDASLKWSYTTGERVKSSPAIGADGTVYVGSWDNKLYAINPDGSFKWSYTTGGSVGSSPAIGADGTVYVGSDDSKLYALNADGSLKWSYTTGDYIYSSPAIGADGTVYVGCYDNSLYAINPDGSFKWSYTTGGLVGSSPAIGVDGTIYVGGSDNKLYAINPGGTLKWSYTTGDEIWSSPAIGADGTVYVGSRDYKLYALNPDGTFKWSYATGLWVQSCPAIGADGTVYVGSDDFNLYALNPDGTLKWSYTTGFGVNSSPAIGADGTVYVGSEDGKLYAIGPGGG